jgi:hypothetical protein
VTLSAPLVGAFAALERACRARQLPKQEPEPIALVGEQGREACAEGPWDLAATGRIATLIYDAPDEGEQIAKDTVVLREFDDGEEARLRARRVHQGEHAGGRPVLLVDVRRVAPGASRFRIVYDVFDDPNDRSRRRRAELLHDAAPKGNPDDPFGFGRGGCVLPLPSGR